MNILTFKYVIPPFNDNNHVLDLQNYTHLWKNRTAIKALLLYFNLCVNVKFKSL